MTGDYLAARREAVRALRARLAAGDDEATAAHDLGFETAADVDAHVAAIVAGRKDSRRPT